MNLVVTCSVALAIFSATSVEAEMLSLGFSIRYGIASRVKRSHSFPGWKVTVVLSAFESWSLLIDD